MATHAEDPRNDDNFLVHNDIESHIPAEANSGYRMWHPKISPYRLWVIATTIGFGTAKSVSELSGTGNSFIPTTLEWIAGTVIFLICFSVSSYDVDDKPAPKYLSWLFEPDCLDSFWSFLHWTLSVERPKYSSIEARHPRRPKSDHPALTHYRLLVVLTVTSFGLSKAKLAYSGQSAAMTWTDWALAVPVTTILYILGLYEYNNFRIGSSFFLADRKSGLSVGIISTLGIVISLASSTASFYGLYYSLKHPEWLGEHPSTRPPPATATRAFIDVVFYHSFRIFARVMLFSQVVMGFSLLGLTLNFFGESMKIDCNMVLSVGRKARRALVQKAAPVVQSLSFEMPKLPRLKGYSGSRSRQCHEILRVIGLYIRQPIKILFHVLLHLFLIGGCLVIIGVLLGTLTSYVDAEGPKWDFWKIVLSSPVLVPFGGTILFFVVVIVFIVYSIFSNQI